MGMSQIIFDKSQGKSIVKMARHGSSVIAVLDDGTLLQDSDYGNSIRMPPDMLGLTVMDLEDDPNRQSPSVILSDSSRLHIGAQEEWMASHGYKVLGSSWVVSPDGRLWRWSNTNGRLRGSRRGIGELAWRMKAELDLSSIKKLVASQGDNSEIEQHNIHMLMHDGQIKSMLSENGNSMIDPAPWAEEGWRFTDITSRDGGVHAITTDGQVVTPLFGKNYGHIRGGLAWPLPDSDAVCFMSGGGSLSVKTRSGSVVFYTTRSDWAGANFYPDKDWGDVKCVAYPKAIVGKRDGDWLELAGTILTMGKHMGVEGFAPSNLRSRAKIKTMKMLGSL
jgi:hypothetical protein